MALRRARGLMWVLLVERSFEFLTRLLPRQKSFESCATRTEQLQHLPNCGLLFRHRFVLWISKVRTGSRFVNLVFVCLATMAIDG